MESCEVVMDSWVCETCIEKSLYGNLIVFCFVSRKDLFPIRNKDQLNDTLSQTPEDLVKEFNLSLSFGEEDEYTIIGDEQGFRIKSDVFTLKAGSMEYHSNYSTLSDVITRGVFLKDEEVTNANCGITGNVHVKKSIIISFILG